MVLNPTFAAAAPRLMDLGLETLTPNRSSEDTVATSPRLRPDALLQRAFSASSNFSGCDAAYRRSSRSLSAGRMSVSLPFGFSAWSFGSPNGLPANEEETAPPRALLFAAANSLKSATTSLDVASPNTTLSSTLPTSPRPYFLSIALTLAAMEVCTESFACASMNRGNDSTARLSDPVLASASRRPPPVFENAFAFSASALRTRAMCSCLSSTKSGSLSFKTACFFCTPLAVSMTYSYRPRGDTGSRSNTMASYVHSRASGATGSHARSKMSTSHVLPNGGIPPEASFLSPEDVVFCLFRKASIIRYSLCATFAAGEVPAAPSTPRSLYRMVGNSLRDARSVASRVAAVSAAAETD